MLFIDEIHRLNPNVEEVLYPAMEDFAIDIIIGKGPGARSVRIDLPRFTLIGATTRLGMLSSPLRDRFGIKEQLELYTPESLKEIVVRSADILHIDIDEEGALEIASRSRGTPRIANRLLRRVRDYSQVRGSGVIDLETAQGALAMLKIDEEGALEIASRSRGTPRIANRLLRRVRDYSQVRGSGVIDLPTAQGALSMLKIDELGLDAVDRKMLTAMIEIFRGGPVGLDTIAAYTGEDAGTVEDVYEPYLLKLGFIARTTRGRVVLPDAYRHLDYPVPTTVQQGSLEV